MNRNNTALEEPLEARGARGGSHGSGRGAFSDRVELGDGVATHLVRVFGAEEVPSCYSWLATRVGGGPEHYVDGYEGGEVSGELRGGRGERTIGDVLRERRKDESASLSRTTREEGEHTTVERIVSFLLAARSEEERTVKLCRPIPARLIVRDLREVALGSQIRRVRIGRSVRSDVEDSIASSD